MNIKDAIHKAIEGGWRKGDRPIIEQSLDTLWVRFEREEKERSLPVMYLSDLLLDPKFWQALGKSEGWEGNGWNKKPLWLNGMHKFIDNLAQDQSLEEAFNNATA